MDSMLTGLMLIALAVSLILLIAQIMANAYHDLSGQELERGSSSDGEFDIA